MSFLLFEGGVCKFLSNYFFNHTSQSALYVSISAETWSHFKRYIERLQLSLAVNNQKPIISFRDRFPNEMIGWCTCLTLTTHQRRLLRKMRKQTEQRPLEKQESAYWCRRYRDNTANNFHSNTSQKQKTTFERMRINKEAKPGLTNVGFAEAQLLIQ